MNQPSNWSQVQMRTEGETNVIRPGRDPKICDRSSRESRNGLLEHARHPFRLIGNPPPLQTFVERRSGLLLRALPLSRARRQLDEEPDRF